MRSLFRALRRLLQSAGDLLAERAGLLVFEARQEAARLVGVAVLALLAGLCALLAVVLLSALVLTWFWETHRIQAIGAMAGAYALLALLALWWLRRLLRAEPFAASRAELRQDLARLEGPRRRGR